MSNRFSVGEVVAKRDIPVQNAPAEEPAPMLEEEKPASGLWSSTASLADQFTNEKWESHVRMGPPQVAVFSLPDQQKDANDLLAKSKPDGSPGIIVLKSDPMQSDHKLVLFVLYHTVEYRRIVGDPTA